MSNPYCNCGLGGEKCNYCRIGEQGAEIKRLRRDLKEMERKVITCGVAATNPDRALTIRADYMKWNSPQAESVRAIRSDLAEAVALLREIEWTPTFTAHMCSYCDSDRPFHLKTCRLAALLAKHPEQP